MSVDASTLEQFTGKQVILHHIQENGDIAEREGKVDGASEAGMAFKEKGKRDVELVLPSEIEEITLAPVKPKNLSQKKLKLVTESTARQHLLDRHGFARSEVNAMTEEEGFAAHDQIDHDDLGHRHVAADESKDEESSDSEE